jgi:hypothetical protein
MLIIEQTVLSWNSFVKYVLFKRKSAQKLKRKILCLQCRLKQRYTEQWKNFERQVDCTLLCSASVPNHRASAFKRKFNILQVRSVISGTIIERIYRRRRSHTVTSRRTTPVPKQ